MILSMESWFDMAKVSVQVLEGSEALRDAIQLALDHNVHVLPYTSELIGGDVYYTLISIANSVPVTITNNKVPDIRG